MIFVRLKNRVVTGALLGVICGGAVAEKDNMTLPETTNNSGAVESSTVQEQPEKMALIITEMDKLQFELAREISIGKQASVLKALADSFADLPPDTVKALLERGGEPGYLQRAVEALHAQRSVEINPKLTAENIIYIEVPKADHGGRVILMLGGIPYSVAVGESFAIRQAHFRSKHYKVIAIQYRSPSEIELRLETEGRTTHLIKKI